MLIRTRQGQRLVITPITDKTWRVEFAFDRALIAEVKAMEGATWHGYHGADCKLCGELGPQGKKFWTISNSKRNIFALNQLESPGIPRYDNAVPTDTNLTLKNSLREHQQKIVSEVGGRKRIVIAGDPGIGKTLPMLELIANAGGKWLVVCPKSVRNVWIAEAKKWGFEGLITEWARGSDGIKIITYHHLADWVARMPAEELKKITGVVEDEAHNMKNPKAQRTEAALILSELIPEAFWINMTGTPSPKDPTDWWTLTELCCPGFLRESSPAKLRERLGIFSDQGDYRKLVDWNKAEIELLYKRLKGMVLIIRKDDCLDLPEKIYDPLYIECDKQTLTLAKALAKLAPNGLSALMRLRQFSDGYAAGTEESPAEQWDTPKDDALRDDLDALSGSDRNRVVIFGGFTATVDKIVAICLEKKWSVIRQDGRGLCYFHRDGYLVSSYRDPISEVFDTPKDELIAYVAQPEAGGVGVNLQASDIAIFYSNTFKGAARMQAEDRVHRLGQTRKTRIRDYFFLPTDKKVFDNLMRKKELQNWTLGEIEEAFNDPSQP